MNNIELDFNISSRTRYIPHIYEDTLSRMTGLPFFNNLLEKIDYFYKTKNSKHQDPSMLTKSAISVVDQLISCLFYAGIWNPQNLQTITKPVISMLNGYLDSNTIQDILPMRYETIISLMSEKNSEE